MSMFDSMISQAEEKFNLGGKAGTLLSALLALITDGNHGGFAGFLGRFNAAGLGDTVSSWINSGSNTPISSEQIESALGEETLRSVAAQTGTDYATTASATAFMTPHVVDALTPSGVIPQDGDLLTRIGGYLTGTGGAALGGIGAAQAATFDRIGTATDDNVRSIGDRAGGDLSAVDNDGDGSILKWLIPLILLGLLIFLGYTFCGKSTPVAVTNANTNANASANVKPNSNQAVVVSNNANAAGNSAVAPVGERKLTEVSLPDGTKLQAYPGGIEDQLIKFIQSDEYKNGTNDTLKDRWFSFDDLNFKFGTTELVPESKRQLDNIMAILKAFPAVKIKIGGYTDKKGDDAANKKLSDSRAKAVKSALEKSGVGAQVPEAEGYGEEFAKVPETASDKEREADRKTSVRLLK